LFTFYYGSVWKGTRIDIGARYYLYKKKLDSGSDGLYVFTQLGIGNFRTPYTVTRYGLGGEWQGITLYEFLKNERSTAYGLGVGLGYRKALNKIFIDANFRFQGWTIQKKEKIKIGNDSYKPESKREALSFGSVGPGALFAPMLLIGYIF
jgi:hypothetical protein